MVAENSKATAMQDNVEQNILAYQTSDSNYAKYIKLRKHLNDIEAQQLHTTNVQELENLKIDYNNITMQLGIYKSLSHTAFEGKTQTYNFKTINDYLAKNNFNVLSFFVGNENIYLLFVDAQTRNIQFTKCDTSLLDSVQKLVAMQGQQNVFNQNQNRFIQLSNTIYKNIVGSIATLSLTKTTIILTDDVLNNLAFDALITDVAKHNSFLIKQNKMSMAYSIRSLMSQQQRPFLNSKSVLILAPFTKSAIRNLPQLEGSILEAKNITALYKSTNLIANTAAFLNFENNLITNKYIHIASHATAGETPRLEFFDSSVLINSIYQIPMAQSFAYLNTCQSGSGINYYSEGNLSLGRAFYSNGVHNVALTFWNTNDESSSELSTLFYKNLMQNSNSIDAMHKAKLAYLSSQSMDKQAPYYWASVQHIGDGVLDKEKEIKWWWILGSGVLIIGLVGYKKLKTK
jgi:CHAT domain-containing protein